MNQKGLLFSTDAVVGIGVLLLVLSYAATAFLHTTSTYDTKNWQQTQIIFKAQAYNLTHNTPPAVFDPTGKANYFCYTAVHPQRPPISFKYCEETK